MSKIFMKKVQTQIKEKIIDSSGRTLGRVASEVAMSSTLVDLATPEFTLPSAAAMSANGSNQATISQASDLNVAYISQTGAANYAAITQTGNNASVPTSMNIWLSRADAVCQIVLRIKIIRQRHFFQRWQSGRHHLRLTPEAVMIRAGVESRSILPWASVERVALDLAESRIEELESELAVLRSRVNELERVVRRAR